jgi:hypothetical protein
LFAFDNTDIQTIVIRSLVSDVNLLTEKGLQWLTESVFTDKVEIRHGGKPFGEDRNAEVFEIIKQGAILSEGNLYNQFKEMLKL